MSAYALSRHVIYAVLLLLPFASASHAADTAVNFDGGDDFIYVASSSTLQEVTDRSFSWCAWAKPASIPPACNSYSEYCVYAVLARPWNHTYIGYTYAQQFSARVWNASNASFTLASGTIGPGAWHHLCMSVDDTAKQMAFYVDGTPVAGSPKTYTGALKDYGSTHYYIGAANPKHWAEEWFFKGAIDEVRIYNRALSAAEVSTQRNGGLGQYGLPEAGLVAGWHMNEGSGWLAGDYSGNGNTGLLAQGPGWVPGLVVTPAGTTPPPAPQGLTIEGESMATKTTGASLGWAWALYTNGYVEHPVAFSPADGYVFAVQVTGNYDGGYPQFNLRLDQQNIATQTTSSGGTTYGFFKKAIAAGTHQVAVAHINDYNNRALYVDRVRIVPIGASAPVDTTPPTVSLTAPAGGATVSGTVTVSATASDNVGVAGVQFKLDGANLGAEDTSNPYSVIWDTTTAANGSHTLTAVARDAAGNTGTATAVTVTVNNVPPDTMAPVITFTSPTDGKILVAP